MNTEKVTSPLAMLAHWVATRGDKIWLRQPHSGQWITYTWQDADARISQMAAALQNLNLPVGSSIAIMSKNCAHWIMAELAIWKAGYVSVPLYPNFTGEGAAQILRHPLPLGRLCLSCR